MNMSTKHMYGAFLLALCLVVVPMSVHAQSSLESNMEREARLRAELAQVEQEQRETEQILYGAQQQSSSLKRDILILDTKIRAAELNIKAKNLIIASLGKDITKKEQAIGGLVERIDKGRASLADILRKTNEVGAITIPEIILSRQNVTDVFADLDTFESVQESLKITFEGIRTTKTQTESEKNTLDKRRGEEFNARKVILQEQKNIAMNQAEKQRLLGVSKGNEKTYGTILAEKQRKAAEIRSALFALAGGGKAIPFGDALKYAQKASSVTGIRPAFLLAVIMQESNLGANVGSCYVTDLSTGDGQGKNTATPFQQVMKAPRDTVPFKNLTEALGRNWQTTPVSCPIIDRAHAGSTNYYVGRGYGGGMGPAQFIPSTWELFKTRIANALTVVNADPWNNEHAFTASAMYLTDLGAIGGSYTGEIAAACKYFGTGGASCAYGSQVQAKADNIQHNMIDPLQGV